MNRDTGMAQRALITGAAGFVGQHLAAHLRSCGDEVFLTDHSAAVLPPAVPGAVLDVTNEEQCRALFAEWKPTVVYHLAGLAYAPDAERDFAHTLAVNVAGVHTVCRALAEVCPQAAVLVVSSSEVYGKIEPRELPATEVTPCRPTHAYGLSKCMAELVAERFARTSSLRVVVARAFNHIGPGQRPKFVVPSFASQIVEIIEKRRPPVLEVGNLSPERDFTDVRDIVRGYRLAALEGRGLYVFCSGRPVTIEQVLKELCSLAGVEIEVKVDPARVRPAEVPSLWGQAERAKTELGWETAISLRDTLRDVLDSLRTAAN